MRSSLGSTQVQTGRAEHFHDVGVATNGTGEQTALGLRHVVCLGAKPGLEAMAQRALQIQHFHRDCDYYPMLRQVKGQLPDT